MTSPDTSPALQIRRPSILSKLTAWFSGWFSHDQTFCDDNVLSEDDRTLLGMANRDMRKPAQRRREASLQELSRAPGPVVMQHHPLNLLTKGAMHR